MAHRCWALDEIVRAIAANLVADSKRDSAVALASCSKSLEEPALGEVWRSLPSLVPLVKCFPPEVWEVRKKQLVFKRVPLRAEWTRFQKRYASKIQCLQYLPGDRSGAISVPTFHILQQYCPGTPLLPNLVSLRWATDETCFPFISPFISPSLMSINISAPSSDKASLMLPLILNKLSTLSPNIREIEIIQDDISIYNPSLKEASSQLLMNCNPHLRKFELISPISASALRHLIQLPSLEELNFATIKSFQLPHTLPSLVFPSLRQLKVRCNSDRTWLKLLSAIENPVLTTIDINCPGRDVEQFMKAFQITISGCAVRDCVQEFSVVSRDDFKITPGIIACNFQLKNLTALNLESYCSPDHCQTYDLTDGDIDLLTEALPCLVYLMIGGSPCGVPSQVTFKSLYTISHRCPQLQHLTIHFNPALFVAKVGNDSEPWDVALGLSDVESLSSDLCSLTSVVVGSMPLPSQYNSPCVMALGLLRVFPHLKDILHDGGDWEHVQDLIEVCRCVGVNGFAFGKG